MDLNDDNHPERRGDYTVYSGKRAIQSVAASRGQTVAFVAESRTATTTFLRTRARQCPAPVRPA